MTGYINGVDWINIEPMKYWSFPSGYKGDKLQDAKKLVFSGEYVGALKVDGYYERCGIDEDGVPFMIARSKNVNGEAVNKIDWVPQLKEFLLTLPRGTAFLCECYLPNNEGSQKITSLLGCLREKCIERQHKQQMLNFYIFDVMAYDGKNYLKTKFEDRINKLYEIKKEHTNKYVQYATYLEGEKLWTALQQYLSDGREGIVIMRKDAIVYQKRTPARISLKIKKELQETIDCFFTGRISAPTKVYNGKEIVTWPYWINEHTGERLEGNYYKQYMDGLPYVPVTKPYFYQWAGSLEIAVLKEGNVFPIGWLSGVTDDIKANPNKYKNKCIEVTAMMFTEDGALRHGKMLRFRDDKNYTECSYEQIKGF